jgi:tetratricopeptide (TPR) repeat protein
MRKNTTFIGIFTLALMLSATSMVYSQSEGRPRSSVGDRRLTVGPAQTVTSLPIRAKRYALVIGIDQYQDGLITSLKGATNDAKALADALARYAGFPQDQIILLTSDQQPGKQPTRAIILGQLALLRNIVPKDGMLLVAFAGHGIERGGTAYLLPSDARVSDIALLEDTAISITQMKERIRATGVDQVMLILDACRNDPVSGRGSADNPLTEAYAKGFNFDVRNREVKAVVTLFATSPGQRAYEFDDKQQGYFTYTLIEALKGKAANDNGEVTLASLVKYLQHEVPRQVRIALGREQKPYVLIDGYKADDLVISFTVKEQLPIDPKTELEKIRTERERINAENEKIKAQFAEMKKHFDAGLALSQKQDYEGAISEFEQAATIDDNQPTIYANLALAYFNLGATRFNNKQKDEAQKLFRQSADYGEKATHMNPTNSEFLKIYGDACDILFRNFQLSEYANKALASYTAGSVAENDPAKKYRMLNKIGNIYFIMGYMDKSIATYEKVLIADPNNLEALSGKALVLTASGEKLKIEQAIGIFLQVAKGAPEGSRIKTEAENNIKYFSDLLKKK